MKFVHECLEALTYATWSVVAVFALLGLWINFAHAGTPGWQIPPEFSAYVCVSRVHMEGVTIAAERWAEREDAKTANALHSIVDANIQAVRERGYVIPEWFEQLLGRWIDEAFAWQGSREDWIKDIQAKCVPPREPDPPSE